MSRQPSPAVARSGHRWHVTATEYHVVTAGKTMIQVSRLLSAYRRGEQRGVASQPDAEPAMCAGLVWRNLWEDEERWRREEDNVGLIECKEACPSVGGEKRRSAASEMACEEGSPCPAVVEMSLSKMHMSSNQQQEGQHNNNIELYICMQGSSTYIQPQNRTSLTSAAGCLLVHPVVCTSAIKVCIGGSSTCSNHGR